MDRRLDLTSELKSLRKGRGVFAGRMATRLGPALRATCGITEDDGPATVRRKVEARLAELVAKLPADLHQATKAAFALDAECRLPLYQERVQWAAERMDRDARTVRRKVDHAIAQLAELVADEPERDGSWHTSELRVAVALDRDRPEVLVQRRVVAGQDDLRRLEVSAPLPVPRRGADVRVLYGGTLVDGRDGADLALALPVPVHRGGAHEFAVTFRLPAGQCVLSLLECAPEHPCDLFDLRVRFDRDRPPPRVWALPGAFRPERRDPACQGHRHPVDGAGEVHLRFRGLIPGLTYGARWEPHEEPVPVARRCG